MKNPRAISDELLESIYETLDRYEHVLENMRLSFEFDPQVIFQQLDEIKKIKRSILYAKHGETDSELLKAFEEFSNDH